MNSSEGEQGFKRKITRQQKEFLQRELTYLESQNAVQTVSDLDDFYLVENKKNITSMHTLLWVGAVLVGAGCLTFIASNWSALSSLSKYFLILIGFIGFYLVGWKLESSLPKTSRSLYYIGGIIFGAGIFLIGQTFHLGGAIYSAFMLWAIGIIPLAYYLKDKAIMFFSILLLFGYSTQVYFESAYPFVLLITIPVIYALNHWVLNRSKGIFFLNSMLLLFFVHAQLWHFGVNDLIIIILLFMVGIIFSIKGLDAYSSTMTCIGYVVHGAYALVLSFPFVWEQLFSASLSGTFAIVFSILYGIYLLLLLRHGHIMAVLIVCLFIFRYYIDLSYDFLPKSLFFVIGGIILILCGLWLEKSRRGEMNADEKK